MALQTAVTLNPVPGYFGQQFFLPSLTSNQTYAAGSSAASMYFGQGVVSTDGATVNPPVIGSTLVQFVGFVVLDAYAENNPAAGFVFTQGYPVAVCRAGEIYASASVTMNPGDSVYLIAADSVTPANAGSLTNVNSVMTQTTLLLASVRVIDPVTVSSGTSPVHVSILQK